MCRYASSLLVTFASQAKKLEVTLGPDTGDLALRIGIHSGQVSIALNVVKNYAELKPHPIFWCDR